MLSEMGQALSLWPGLHLFLAAATETVLLPLVHQDEKKLQQLSARLDRLSKDPPDEQCHWLSATQFEPSIIKTDYMPRIFEALDHIFCLPEKGRQGRKRVDKVQVVPFIQMKKVPWPPRETSSTQDESGVGIPLVSELRVVKLCH